MKSDRKRKNNVAKKEKEKKKSDIGNTAFVRYSIYLYYLFFCVFGIAFSELFSPFSCLSLYIFHLYEHSRERFTVRGRKKKKSLSKRIIFLKHAIFVYFRVHSLKIEVFSERAKKKKKKKEKKKKEIFFCHLRFISSGRRKSHSLLNSERGIAGKW